MYTKNKQSAFTLVELLIVMMISSILIVVTVSVFTLFRKETLRDQNRVVITQNGRVAFDRMSREIRQTPAIVTEFPDDASDVSIAQPGEIEFQDGHADDLTYHRYYVSSGTLKLDTNEYYFSYDTTSRVLWNTTGTGGVSPVKHVISTQDIADNVQGMVFYGAKPIQFQITTADSLGQTFTMRTKIYERNI